MKQAPRRGLRCRPAERTGTASGAAGGNVAGGNTGTPPRIGAGTSSCTRRGGLGQPSRHLPGVAVGADLGSVREHPGPGPRRAGTPRAQRPRRLLPAGAGVHPRHPVHHRPRAGRRRRGGGPGPGRVARRGRPLPPRRRPARAPGPTARSSCAACSASRTRSPWVCAGPTHDERSWTFDLDPGGRRPGAGDRAAAGGLLRALPGLPAGHHRAGDGRRPQRPGRHQRLPADDARLLDASGRAHHRDGRARPVPRGAAATRSTRSCERVFTDVNNGVYRCRLRRRRRSAYEARVRPPVHRPGLA